MPQTNSISDLFAVVWPIIFAVDLTRYLVAAGALATILAIFAGPLAARRIQSRAISWKDIRREIGYSMNTVLVFSLVGFAVFAAGQHGYLRIYFGAAPGATKLVLEFVAIVVLHDAYFYWMHRFMHTPRLFRRVHRVHHKSKTPTPWAAYAFAPAEAFLEAAILPFAALILPMHDVTVFLFVMHMIVRNVIGHAGVELFPSWWLRTPFLRAFTTTTHHDLHHSHGGYNFGLYFTWWDRLMGTEHPDYHRKFAAVTQGADGIVRKSHVVPYSS
jgi:sterol desaturase/sphingolipid hydroxylase (fatty acid hydroxylase superfamily)